MCVSKHQGNCDAKLARCRGSCSPAVQHCSCAAVEHLTCALQPGMEEPPLPRRGVPLVRAPVPLTAQEQEIKELHRKKSQAQNELDKVAAKLASAEISWVKEQWRHFSRDRPAIQQSSTAAQLVSRRAGQRSSAKTRRILVLSWGYRFEREKRMAEAALRGRRDAVVDASVLQKDPSYTFPKGRGWNINVQNFVLAQEGAPCLVQQLFNFCRTSDVVGVFCKSGHHRSVAIAEIAADWFRRSSSPAVQHEVCVLHLNSERYQGWSANKLNQVLCWRKGETEISIPGVLMGAHQSQVSNCPAGTAVGEGWLRQLMVAKYQECLAAVRDANETSSSDCEVVEPDRGTKRSRQPEQDCRTKRARQSEQCSRGDSYKKLDQGTNPSRQPEPDSLAQELRQPDQQPSYPVGQHSSRVIPKQQSNKPAGELSQLEQRSSSSDGARLEQPSPTEHEEPRTKRYWEAAEVMESLLSARADAEDLKQHALSPEYTELREELTLQHEGRNNIGVLAQIMAVQAQWRIHDMGLSESDLRRYMKGPILQIELQMARGSTHRAALARCHSSFRKRYQASVNGSAVHQHNVVVEAMYYQYIEAKTQAIT